MVSTRQSAAATGVVGSSRAVISGPESGSKLLAMGTSDSDGSDVSDDEEPESDWERRGEKGKSKSKVQSAAKRRKVAGNANSSTTKTTKITRRKKDISLLLTMPLDVIFAVFLELELRDLVMLTRTSKLLRETLVARNALSVWKSIREEREVPEPPQDFSEPRWASLLFGGSWCQCCGAPNIQTIDFYLRRRLCTKCKKQNYVVESKFTGLFPGQDKALLDLIPHTNTGGWAHGHASKSRFYWKADIEDLISQWTVLKLKNTADAEKKLEEFRKEKKEFVAGVLEDAVSYLTWSRRSSLERDDDSRERRKHRAAAIRQKFLDMGYSANDILYIMNRRSVDSPNELTDRGWARIRGGLEKTLIDERDRRIEQERQRRISRRLDTFKKILDTHTLTLLPPMWLQYPHWREVAAFPVFDDVLSASDDVIVDEESFQPAIAQLPGLVATWLEDRKAKLSQLASAHALTPHPTTTDAVNLATSVFKCGNSSCVNDKPAWTSISTNPLFGWTDAARHVCEEPQRSLYYGAFSFSRRPAPLVKTVVDFFQEASVVAAQIVQLVGLDPSRATVEDMDRGYHYFFCSGCQGPRRTVYTWRTAVAHVAQHGHVVTPSLQILTSHQVHAATMPGDPGNGNRCWLCYHCSAHILARQTKAAVVDHIISQHGIQIPQEPVDYLCYCRERSSLMMLPQWQEVSIKQPKHIHPGPSTTQNGKNIRCIHCHGSRLFEFQGVKAHLKAKHRVDPPEPNRDFVYI